MSLLFFPVVFILTGFSVHVGKCYSILYKINSGQLFSCTKEVFPEYGWDFRTPLLCLNAYLVIHCETLRTSSVFILLRMDKSMRAFVGLISHQRISEA